ncbi:hypothetical protein JOF29_004010 [Kribbella aluminosa]|uniref:DUF4158 domain-containing protein n=2 Tax=Kribbella aluminosa TaxID=416017 RepID=A0ABS4UMP6_9ACTN|nr:DUF4158 domain-containing protein [Kribbella aluminosa]MBP2352927.1 hypothetical protein [Kribbella aluminosa]
MPVEFLSDEMVAAYSTFGEVPPSSDLEKFFFLDASDRDLIAQSRADSHRLGVAVQICTVRYKGLFLEDLLAVPWPVVDYLAEQLEIGDASAVQKYTERPKTSYEHAWKIQAAYGFVTFGDRESWRASAQQGVPDVPARAGVDARGGAGGVVRPVGGLAAPAPGAAAGVVLWNSKYLRCARRPLTRTPQMMASE